MPIVTQMLSPNILAFQLEKNVNFTHESYPLFRTILSTVPELWGWLVAFSGQTISKSQDCSVNFLYQKIREFMFQCIHKICWNVFGFLSSQAK